MKIRTRRTPEYRIKALLCAVAIVLTACGGETSDTSTGTPPSTASFIGSSADHSSEGPASAMPSPASARNALQVNGAGAFALAGYDNQPLASPAALTVGNEPATGDAPLPTPVIVPIAHTGPSTMPTTSYNYYVSPDGSDTADGSQTAPFLTLARAARAVTKAGTTVWVAPGVYEGGIQTKANGTADSRIYWISTTKGGAKIVPPASSRNSYAWDNQGDYVNIIGFEVDGSNSLSGVMWRHGIYTAGAHGVIAGNTVHHLAQTIPCTGAGGSAIGMDVGDHGELTDIIGNVVHDIGPAGCTFVHGIYVSTSGSVKNNLVFRVTSAAIHLWHDAANVVITNNTVTTSGYGIIVGGGNFYHSSAGADNVYVANNIVFDNERGISEQGKTGTSNVYEHNLVAHNRIYGVSLQNGLHAGATVTADPLFVDYPGDNAVPDFHLASGSPAIGNGTATNAYPTDLVGRPRNADTGYDIGAYQH